MERMTNEQRKAWDLLTGKLAEALSLLDCSGDEARANAYEGAAEAYRACYDGFPSGVGRDIYREDYRRNAIRYRKRAIDLRAIIGRGL